MHILTVRRESVIGRLVPVIIVAMGILALTACTAKDEPEEDVKPPVDQGIYELVGVEPPTWTVVRSITAPGPTGYTEPPYDVSGAPVTPEEREFLSRLASLPEDEDSFTVGVGVSSTGLEYAVNFKNSSLETVAEYVRKQQGSGASIEENDTEPQKPPDLVPKGLSNAVDGRQRFAVADGFSVFNQSLRRIGQVGGTCTGTLFGKRLMITAAHCYFGGGNTSINFNATFTPRRDGNDAPYGSPSIYTYWYPKLWFINNCHITYTGATASKCVPFDWVIIVLKDEPFKNSPNGNPGWMGFWYAPDTTLNSFYMYNIGYPLCNRGFPPANCMSNFPYGDTSNCGPAQYLHKQAGWPVNNWGGGTIRHRCDTSPGHSGGPVYTYSAGQNGPYILGIMVWNSCWDNCDSKSTYSSEGPRITKAMGDWMLNLRGMY